MSFFPYFCCCCCCAAIVAVIVRCQLAAAIALHLQSLFNISACTLAYLLCFPPPRGAQQQQQHNNNKNRSTAQSNEHPLPSVAFSLPCRIRRLLRLKLLLTPLYSQLRRRPHVLPEVVVATAAASAAVVAVALMPFFHSTSCTTSVCAGLPLCRLPPPFSSPPPILCALPCPMLSAYIG